MDCLLFGILYPLFYLRYLFSRIYLPLLTRQKKLIIHFCISGLENNLEVVLKLRPYIHPKI